MIRSYKYHKMFCNEIAAVRREDLLFSAQASLRFVQLDRTSAVRKSMISMCLLLELDLLIHESVNELYLIGRPAQSKVNN